MIAEINCSRGLCQQRRAMALGVSRVMRRILVGLVAISAMVSGERDGPTGMTVGTTPADQPIRRIFGIGPGAADEVIQWTLAFGDSQI